jgi:hypothetical protein
MKEYTKPGLLLIIIGILISMGSTGLMAAGANAPCLGALAGLILLIGFILMFIGRKEFGERHAKFVVFALIAFIIGLVIVILGAVIIAIGTVSSAIASEGEIDYEALGRSMGTGFTIIVIGGIVFAIGEVLLVYDLESEIGKRLLVLAAIASIVASVAVLALITDKFGDFVRALEKTEEEQEMKRELQKFERESNAIQAFGLIGTFLFLIAYIIPYMRIARGELRAIVKPEGLYPGYPSYPPTQPYQQQPTYTSPQPPYETPLEPLRPEKCRYCNSDIPEGKAYCPRCGRDVWG